MIPVLPTTEVMAWEFRVRNGDDTYLVYINAMTGKEQVVLQSSSRTNQEQCRCRPLEYMQDASDILSLVRKEVSRIGSPRPRLGTLESP